MNAEDTAFWQRAADLFDQLLESPVDARPAALSRACGGDAALLAAVGRLLGAHQRALGESTEGSAGGGARAAVSRALDAWAAHGELAPGTLVGPFTVLRVLGAGGMGQVYLAERDVDGRRQPVALKLPRQGLSVAFLQRFRRERAILAQLAHPAIARLIDAGDLSDGRPWLAMEYVEGEPILDWCQRTGADLRTRIRLVVAILDALQHAHERLVLHRDIKSANVLVDAAGQPRLLDFGIGKDLGEGPGSTADGQRYFTLASAAPEQVLGAPSSAATDVYAVGVLLYRLLSSCAPIEYEELGAHAALQEALQRVPPLASAAVAALPAARLQEAAAERRLRPAAWVAALRGDIDQVLARALRKEPSARYHSAQGFADDLRALLELRPISARSSERLYRARRFLRRHALAATLSSALLASLAGFLGYTLLQAAALRAARDQAEQRQRQAETARDQAEQVTAFLKSLFRQTDPNKVRGQELDARELLRRGVADLQRSFSDAPLLRAELLETLADIHISLNDFVTAVRLAREALELRRRNPEGAARSHEQLARLGFLQGDLAAAAEHLAALLPSPAPPPGPEVPDAQLRWLTMRAELGLSQDLDAERSVTDFRALLAEHERRFGRQDERTQRVRKRLSLALGAAGQEAEELRIEEELTRDVRVGGDELDPVEAFAAVRRARVLRKLGRLDEARETAEWALGVQRAVFGEHHAQVALALEARARIERSAGNSDLAMHYYARAVQAAEVALPADSPQLAGLRFNAGSYLLQDLDRPLDALEYLEPVVARSAGVRYFALFKLTLAQAYAAAGRVAEAQAGFEDVLVMFRQAGIDDPVKLGKVEAQIVCLLPPERRPPDFPGRLERLTAALESAAPEDGSLKWLRRCSAP